MKTLIHLCKKDFIHAKPWILGTWLTLAISTLLPWISPEGEAAAPFMMFQRLAPAVMIFLTCAKIIHCDPFVGTSAFMGTRPVRATTLLRNKLVLIALVLVLPAAGFALLHAACMRLNLSALEWQLLFIENWLYFSLIAGAAVAYAVISRNVGIMVIFVIATPSLFLMLLAMFHLNWPFGKSLEDQHLRDSFQLVAQAFLSITAVAIAMNWAAMRRIWLTAAGFLLCAAFLVWPNTFWKWNFVDELSQDARAAEIVSDHVEVQWTDAPGFYSQSISMNNTIYSLVTRPGRVTGLKDGWTGKLVRFQSEARFKDGTVLKSEGVSRNGSFDDPTPVFLPELGIDIAGKRFTRNIVRDLAWPLFECEKSRLLEISDRRASIHGTGTFQINQPVILAELPAQAGASVAIGRTRYKIDSLTPSDEQIYLHLSTCGVPLTSLGDRSREIGRTEFLLVNPATKEFTQTFGSGAGNRAGNVWHTVQQTFWIQQEAGSTRQPSPGEFLQGARLYIIGIRYGGNIKLPYEIPEMLLEEKR
jgi:hypothetical protein